VSAGVGINFECLSRLGTAVRDGSPLHTRVRAADNNGNCPGIDFAGTLDVALGDSTDITMEPFKLDAEACGFVSTTNPERPWCEVLPALAAPAFVVDVRIDCKTDDVGPTPATFFVAVLDGGGTTTTREVQVTVQCPVCGDALLEGDEECDNGAANGTAGNACDTDCFRL
jgi:hypothetical protein